MKTLILVAFVLLSGCASHSDIRGYADSCAKHGGVVYASQFFTIREAECADGSVFRVVQK